MNLSARTSVFASVALFFASRMMCADELLVPKQQVTTTGLTMREIPVEQEDYDKVAALQEMIRRNNDYVAIQNAEITHLQEKMEDFKSQPHTGCNLQEVESFAMGYGDAIGLRQRLVERANISSQEMRKMIDDIRVANLKRIDEVFVAQATTVSAPAVTTAPVTQTTVTTTTTTTPATVVEQATAPVTATSGNADTTVGGDVLKTEDEIKTAEAAKKEGWSLTTKIIIGVLGAAVVIALVIIVLYLQKS